MLRSVEILILPCQAPKVLFCMPLFLVLCVPPALSQEAQPGGAVLPKYLHTETKTEGAVEEVNLLPWDQERLHRIDHQERDDQLHVYVCPKPLQEQMGISFSKKDEVVVTGAKVLVPLRQGQPSKGSA